MTRWAATGAPVPIEASRSRRPAALLLIVAFLPRPGFAQAESMTACADAITTVERATPTPPRLLSALALVESGRRIETRAVAWPWTINVAGTGHYYESKADAISAVRVFQSFGLQSIDVGCMQINLAMHPHAFASLDEAFDPQVNASYGARFVVSLFRASGDWGEAITSYHSKTPNVAANYARRVLAVWPEAVAYGLSSRAAPPPKREDPAYFHAPIVAGRLAQDRLDLARHASADNALRPRSWISALPQPRHGLAWPGQISRRFATSM